MLKAAPVANRVMRMGVSRFSLISMATAAAVMATKVFRPRLLHGSSRRKGISATDLNRHKDKDLATNDTTTVINAAPDTPNLAMNQEISATVSRSFTPCM